MGSGSPEVGLAARVRALRRFRHLSLTALAKEIGTSASFLSQLESGRSNASVATLTKLAQALDVPLAHLFDDEQALPVQVLPAADRPRLRAGDGWHESALTRPPLGNLEVRSAHYGPGAVSAPAPVALGDSQAVLLVLTGSVTFEIDASTLPLTAGDSVEFATTQPHRLVNSSAGDASALWIFDPPLPAESSVEDEEDPA